ncbi:MAG: hypothetical protein EZS28_048478, partial [Streblomastix strix]
DMLLSSFGGAVDITHVLYDNPTYLNTQNFTYYDVLFYKIGTLHIFSVQTAPINTTSLPSVGIATIPTQYAPISNYQFIISGYQNNIINSNFESGNVKVNSTTWANTQILRISGETNNLLNSKADSGVSYTKGEDDALLLLKANQSTTYTKTETDQLISQIEVGDVDLSGYMTLGTSQTITANKTFNNASRFISSIDGMGTITGSQFVNSGADDTVVLLGAGGTKPISEFEGAPTDLSNYYTKTQTYSQIEANNKFVRIKGSIYQKITGRLKYVSPFGETYDETQDPAANTYLTQSEVDAKLTNYVNTTNNQEIKGTKTFNSNVNAAGFAKTGKGDTSVLLAGGGDMLLSSFGGAVDIHHVLYDDPTYLNTQ